MNPIAVIAIGGNSLNLPGERGTFEEAQRNARLTCEGIADVIAAGYRVVLTHGNGPQVGQALLRSEIAAASIPPSKLDECDAETQGEIGYLLQQTLHNVLTERGLPTGVVSVVTQVVVDEKDSAFENPKKPIGDYHTFEEAQERMRTQGWAMVEDAGRGWRRVVASPQPMEIVELSAIRACLNAGEIVIAVGGGGIPVARHDGRLVGVEAVIDKDRVSALLAKHLEARVLIFSTGVDRVAVNFGKPNVRWLEEVGWKEMRRYFQAGEFAPGSMGPKVEAALGYLAYMQRRTPPDETCRAIITSPAFIGASLRGEAGTEVFGPGVDIQIFSRRQLSVA